MVSDSIKQNYFYSVGRIDTNPDGEGIQIQSGRTLLRIKDRTDKQPKRLWCVHLIYFYISLAVGM